ncbi:MAG: T9SS type A sorting domain-containing protein [Chitinophagales bacterium]|nr:T9SS type A sorting domain-containing protein [Chitinophagales bacterium]
MRYFLFCICFLLIARLSAQSEALAPLPVQPELSAAKDASYQAAKQQQRIGAASLPFFDDFNQSAIYPNPTLWEENLVYVNATYPKETVTLGVATFDGTDAAGKPYSLVKGAAGAADKLTSRVINLAGLTNEDNVYLSFYYIAGDLGESPAPPTDFLTVQLLDTAAQWQTVWQKSPDNIFSMRQEFIKIDSNYLRSDFQFRFQTFGNLNGANDTWHIDYVKLDKNRDTAAERNIKEMAYEFPAPSLLKPYYVMPYRHFDTTYLADTVNITVRNNFINVTTDIVDFYEATVETDGTPLNAFSGPSRDFGPLTRNIIGYPKFLIPEDLSGDTVVIKVDYHFDVSAEAGESPAVQANNQMTHRQIFSNYFSYDDGSPERGYWVTGTNQYKMAVKYMLPQPDTLQAIKLKLYPVFGDNANALFSVCVWKNFQRNTLYTAGDIIYQQSGLRLSDLIKEYGADTLNGYFYLPIKPEFLADGYFFPLVVQDTFAVGLIVEDKESLVMGFDRNNNRSEYNFFVNGFTQKWEQSGLSGTMIINPVVGKELPGYLTPVKQTVLPSYNIKVYPNPASDLLMLDGIKGNTRMEIYGVNGQLYLQQQMQESAWMPIGELSAGTYVIRVTDIVTNQTGFIKFIKR